MTLMRERELNNLEQSVISTRNALGSFREDLEEQEAKRRDIDRHVQKYNNMSGEEERMQELAGEVAESQSLRMVAMTQTKPLRAKAANSRTPAQAMASWSFRMWSSWDAGDIRGEHTGDLPILIRHETVDLPFTLDDETNGHRLHPPGA